MPLSILITYTCISSHLRSKACIYLYTYISSPENGSRGDERKNLSVHINIHKSCLVIHSHIYNRFKPNHVFAKVKFQWIDTKDLNCIMKFVWRWKEKNKTQSWLFRKQRSHFCLLIVIIWQRLSKPMIWLIQWVSIVYN